MIYRWYHGWAVFFSFLRQQRVKKHGKGKRDWRTAIYMAACGQYLIDHQYRCPGHMPFLARLVNRAGVRALEDK